MCNQTEKPIGAHRLLKPLARALPCVAAAAILTGCAHKDALVFASNKQLGVKVGVDSKQIPEVSVGYNSQDFALVPLYKAGITDGVSGNHAVVAGVLREADEHLAAAEMGFTGSSLSEQGRQHLKTADSLIRMALDEGGGGKEADEKDDRLLRRIKQESARLLQSHTEPSQQDFKTQITALRSLIEVESRKPALLAEFSDDLKYVGRQDGDQRADAYSVFGSFSGRGAVKSTGGEVSGGMAQFYATGVAAQLLASEGGAAALSADAKSPAAYRYDAALVQARLESQHETELKAVQSQALEQADLADRLVTVAFTEKEVSKRRALVREALGISASESRTELTDNVIDSQDAIRRLARLPRYRAALARYLENSR